MKWEENENVKHYKGGLYTIIGIGRHTENDERLVAFTDSKGIMKFRPFNIFFGYVMVEGQEVERYTSA
jgi:hypothetical protein